MTPKIVHVEISPMPSHWSDPMPEVTAVFDNGQTKILFRFYPDEITFSAAEFVGLTEEQARDLRHSKDVNYLRS